MDERLTFNYGASVSRPERPRSEVTAADVDAATRAREPDERRHDWAFLGLMAFTALLYFRPQDTLIFLRPLHLTEISALVALVALLSDRLGRGLPPTRVTPELVAVVALGAVILMTAPFSIWMGGVIGTFNDMYAKVVLIFILMLNTLNSPRRVEKFTWLIVVATGYIALRAVLDYVRGVNLIENGRVRGAIGGMFRNPNDLALNLVVVLPLAISVVLRTSAGTGRRILAGLAILAMLVAIVATGSRGGAVGLVAMVGIMAMRLVRRRPGLVAAGAFALVMAVPLLPHSYVERLASITDASKDETGSREARRTAMREAWQTFLDHPLTGVGAGQFVNYNPDKREEAWRETHNAVLQVAAEVGVFGLALFVYLIFSAASAPFRAGRLLRRAAGVPDRPGQPPASALVTPAERESIDAHNVAMAASITGWFISAMFASVAYHWTFYYLLALALAPREILQDRLAVVRHAVREGRRKAFAVGAGA